MVQTASKNQQQASSGPQQPLVLLDGGTGREIERRGGPYRRPEWSALALYEDPAIVQSVHESYLEAGADAITINSYAVVPYHIGRERYDRDAGWLLKLAVDLAHDARGTKEGVSILGSIPPICGSYEVNEFDVKFAGPILKDFLRAFRDRVDVLLLETVGSIQEARFYLDTIRQDLTTWEKPVPTWVSFCMESDYGMDQTPHLLTGGHSLKDAVDQLTADGLLKVETVPVVLVNCCDVRLVPQSIDHLVAALPPSSGFRVGAYPNAYCNPPPPAAATHECKEVDSTVTPALLKEQAKEWIRRGATVYGGCCGVGPDHIRALASLKSPDLQQ